MPTKEELEKGFRIGEWDIVPARREFHRGDDVVKPEPKQMQVLMSLAQRDGDVVTRDELVDECWDGRPTADEPINRSISQLRRHLGDTERPYQYIDALVRSGYLLKQAVKLHEPDEQSVEPVVIETRKQSRLWAAVAGLAVIVVALWLLFGGSKPVESVAVIPFTNLSGDTANDYVASGFKEELVHTLQGVPELIIKNVQVSYDGMSISEIGETLAVDSVLIGALQVEGRQLKFNYQLVRTDDDVTIDSGQVAGRRDQLFTLQEELADTLRVKLGGDSGRQLLSQSRPKNPSAYDRYMIGRDLLGHRRQQGNLEQAVELFEESIAMDPSYGPAYLALAEVYVLLPDYRGEKIEHAHAKAIEYVELGIKEDPVIEDAAAAVYGFVYHKQKKWAEAEAAFERATNAQIVEPNAFNWYSLMLGSVGRYDESLAQGLAGLESFPASPILSSRVAIVYTWMNNDKMAGEYFRRARQLGVRGGTHELAEAMFLLRQGDMETASRSASVGISDGGGSTDWVEPVFAALVDPAQRANALAVLDKSVADGSFNPQVESTVRVLLGDTDGALRVARSLVQPGEIYETEFLFLREFMPLWERPEFLELMDTLGIAEYWRQVGCQWQDFAVTC
ncbi:MAG: winged helix-turn-helix domain-containing tetratricopeptide repeat protein [Woeseiaceae bacterium]